MRFDDDSQSFVVDDDFALPARFFINESATIPAHGKYDEMTSEVRVMRCTFENRWSLSIIWGSMTYSTNYDHPWFFRQEDKRPFCDEPTLVEVGIIMPEPILRPARTLDLLPNWRGPTEIPAREIELWGDPLAYVDAAGVRYLVGVVSRFDSHSWPDIEEGPYLEHQEDGGFRFDFAVKVGEDYTITTPQEGTP